MIDAMLHAGPAIRSTNAAPGDNPLSINAAAIGMEPVAHTYIGTDTASTISMVNRGLSLKYKKKSSGTNTVIKPATTKPIISHLPMSCIISK